MAYRIIRYVIILIVSYLMNSDDLQQKSQVPTPHGVRAPGDVGDAVLRGLLGARPADDTTSRPTHPLTGEALCSRMKFTKFTVHFTQISFIISARKTDF